MKNIEEKIKEFFSSEENIKKLMSNEDFMNKISDGVVDAQTYQSEFKKLGLDLTDEEAAQTVEITNKLVTTPPEKLEEISLENVTGGLDDKNKDTITIKVSTTILSLLIAEGLATAIAAIAYHVKFKKCEKEGKTEEASVYKNIRSSLTNLSVSALRIPAFVAIAKVIW